MYSGTHIKCDVKAINKIACGKLNRNTWLFGNLAILKNFQAICKKPGSQLRLIGTQWAGEHIPRSILIYRADNGQVKVKSL